MTEHPERADHRRASGHSPPRRGQGFLGATVTLAAVGAILLYYTNSLASQCKAELKARAGPGACSGWQAAAVHVHGPLTIAVGTCAVLFVITFIWSLLWA